MSNAWFRLYHEFSMDPKVQMLSEADQRRYIMLLCMRCRESRPLKNDEIAFHLHISLKRWERTRKIFIGNQLINDDNSPINWGKRQFASDFSAPRVASHRAKRKAFDNNADQEHGNDDVTLHDCYSNGDGNDDRNGDSPLQKRRSNALDTDTDTDTEKEEEKENPPTPLKGGDRPSRNPEPPDSTDSGKPPARSPKGRSRSAVAKFDPTAVDLPSGIDADLWRRWCVERTAQRKPLTPGAVRQQLADLQDWLTRGLDANQSIRDSISSGWQGLFEPRPRNGGRRLAPVSDGTRTASAKDVVPNMDDLH